MEEFKLYSNNELMDFIVQGIIERQFKKQSINNISDFKNEFSRKHKSNIHSLSNELSKIKINLDKLSILEDIILYSDHYIEIPIYFPQKNFNDLYLYSPNIVALTGKDHINNIHYTMSGQSIEYTLLLLNALKTFYDNKKIGLMDHSIHYIFEYYLDSFNTNTNGANNDLIRKGFSTFTIKIATNKPKQIQYLLKLAESFMFHNMYNDNTGCLRFSNMLHLLQQSDFHRGIENFHYPQPLTNTPQRIYRDHIIDYYSLALSSIEPFAQYLSYYHVLEYFFDEIFKESLRKEFQNKITHPQFSYKNDKELDRIIDFIKKETKNCRENGQGNELESLKLVLKKFIDIDELQERLSPEKIKYFQQHNISFSHAPIISFKDKINFLTRLAQRIYQTRNALVHSKEGNSGRYKPYQDNEELRQEIPLIKLVAEQVIINSSDPL